MTRHVAPSNGKARWADIKMTANTFEEKRGLTSLKMIGRSQELHANLEINKDELVFKVTLYNQDQIGKYIDYWYFDSTACDGAIEFFTRLRDALKEISMDKKSKNEEYNLTHTR